MKQHSRFFALINTVLVASSWCLYACDGADEPSTNESLSESAQYTLNAGPASTELGIAHWNLDDAGIVQGISFNGQTIVKYQILRNHGGIVNVDNSDCKILFDETGETTMDTMSNTDRQFTERLREDLLTASKVVESASPISAVKNSFEWVAFACCNAGYSGVLYQWWSSGWTPYCSFSQQTYSCSGLFDCGTLAANRGCQYWY